MKNFIILFSCLVLMQGCSSNKVQSEQDVQKNTINEIKSNMGAPGKPVEFGITAVLSLHLELSGRDVRKRCASSELLHDQTRPGRECLCIVRPYWHHLAALLSFFHQAGTLIRLRDAITAAPSLHI